eukprot:TRINITY_DN923_c0_g1_i7.p1 TRINITY_DN923_c0_g1~~TRINITY_DN923_c0_g1_i7.p1  ORF type:complete len:691 (-),score=116.14 TRINITY_DN923_c0_g1_i7:680-2752(-)
MNQQLFKGLFLFCLLLVETCAQNTSAAVSVSNTAIKTSQVNLTISGQKYGCNKLQGLFEVVQQAGKIQNVSIVPNDTVAFLPCGQENGTESVFVISNTSMNTQIVSPSQENDYEQEIVEALQQEEGDLNFTINVNEDELNVASQQSSGSQSSIKLEDDDKPEEESKNGDDDDDDDETDADDDDDEDDEDDEEDDDDDEDEDDDDDDDDDDQEDDDNKENFVPPPTKEESVSSTPNNTQTMEKVVSTPLRSQQKSISHRSIETNEQHGLQQIQVDTAIITTNSSSNKADIKTAFQNLVAKNNNLSTFYSLLISVGFETIFNEEDSRYTIFIPTDAAFNILSKDLGTSLEALVEYENVTTTLLNHLVIGEYSSKKLENTNQLQTLAEETISFDVIQGEISITTAGSTCVVIVPDVLIKKNIIAHVVDQVLLPFNKPDLGSVTEVVGEIDSLATFAAMLSYLDINFNLNEFTVFAPNDAAFESTLTALNITFEEFLKNERLLSDIVNYHIIVGQKTRSDEFFDGQELPSLQRNSTQIEIDDGAIVINGDVNDAMIIAEDFHADNAIIHIVDTVLLPYNEVLLRQGEEQQGYETVTNEAPQFLSSSPTCADKTPPGAYTCLDQLRFQKCNADWMIRGGYCERTCNRCPVTEETTKRVREIVEVEADGCGCACDEERLQTLIREVMVQVLVDFQI